MNPFESAGGGNPLAQILQRLATAPNSPFRQGMDQGGGQGYGQYGMGRKSGMFQQQPNNPHATAPMGPAQPPPPQMGQAPQMPQMPQAPMPPQMPAPMPAPVTPGPMPSSPYTGPYRRKGTQYAQIVGGATQG